MDDSVIYCFKFQESVDSIQPKNEIFELDIQNNFTQKSLLNSNELSDINWNSLIKWFMNDGDIF